MGILILYVVSQFQYVNSINYTHHTHLCMTDLVSPSMLHNGRYEEFGLFSPHKSIQYLAETEYH